MNSRIRSLIQTLVAAALAASTSSVATAALLEGGHTFATGLLFIGLGTVVMVVACAVAAAH